MASPGMMQSGLSRQLFEAWYTDKRNGVIITGYCVEGTLAKVRREREREGRRRRRAERERERGEKVESAYLQKGCTSEIYMYLL